MKLYPLSCLLFYLCLIACQETTTQAETVESPPTATTSTFPQIDSDPLPVRKNTENAAIQQTTPLTAYAKQFYTNAYWHYDAAIVIKNPAKGKEYIGKWIKFNPDNTLETGFYDGEVTTGNWALDEGKNLITFVENGASPSYSEWQVKTSSSSDAIMIWVGTKRFNQNNTQIKMLRYNHKPSKIDNQQKG